MEENKKKLVIGVIGADVHAVGIQILDHAFEEAGFDVAIVSGDRDLLQLATKKVKVKIPKTKASGTVTEDYYEDDVRELYGVSPTEFIDMKGLMGDTSDNIPGVPSIGEKTATNLIVSYGSIENAYAHVDEIKPPRAQKALSEYYDMAQMSKELATICITCPIPFSYEEALIGNLYTPEAFKFMKRMEFKSILNRFDSASMEDKENGPQKSFKEVTDKKEAEKIFKAAEKAAVTGLQLITGSRAKVSEEAEQLTFSFDTDGTVHSGKKAKSAFLPVTALAICTGPEEIYCIRVSESQITDSWLTEKVQNLCKNDTVHSVWVLDLKSMLPLLNLTDEAPVYDAGVAGYLLNPLKDTYGYDDLARDYLSMTIPSKSDLIGKENLGDLLETGDEKAVTCACYMGYIAWKAAEPLKSRLEQEEMYKLYTEIEMPLIYSLWHMEQEGVLVKRDKLKEYGDTLKVGIKKLETEIYAETGKEFNINSPKQLGEILFGEMQLPGGKKTKTGYSTAAEVLEKLAPEHPVVQKILDYRQLTKLNSTYAEGLAAYISEDGRIHGKFNQTITATGRISSTEPNLQNIPVRMELGREIRKLFVPREGCVLVDADYSQIELRVLAHMSNDKNLIQAYRQAEDIHAITASQVFHVPLEEVTPQLRRNAKAVNFGIVYGISAFGLGEDLGISRKEATEYIERYFETYPDVKRFLDGLVKTGRKYGEVKTMYGRVRPIPELKSGNFMQRSFGERVAMNSPIQGTAADIIKIAMIRVDQRLRREGLRSRIVLQVHDELLVETWKEELEQVQSILATEMKRAAQLQVELEIDMKTGNSWFETK